LTVTDISKPEKKIQYTKLVTLLTAVTVTEEFVVRPLQLVRWRITQSNCRV